MIFYTINRGSKPEVIVDWAGTQADAKAACKALPVTGIDFAEWKEHDVPTDKPRLLAWLKQYALGEKKAATRAPSSLPLNALPRILQPDSFFHEQSPFSKKE